MATEKPLLEDIKNYLLNIWEEVLGESNLKANDDFFELGGHSLNTIIIYSKISEKYGVQLADDTMYQFPTIAELSLRVHSAM